MGRAVKKLATDLLFDTFESICKRQPEKSSSILASSQNETFVCAVVSESSTIKRDRSPVDTSSLRRPEGYRRVCQAESAGDTVRATLRAAWYSCLRVKVPSKTEIWGGRAGGRAGGVVNYNGSGPSMVPNLASATAWHRRSAGQATMQPSAHAGLRR